MNLRLLLALGPLLACTTAAPPDKHETVSVAAPPSAEAPPTAQPVERAAAPAVLGPTEPLRESLVAFEGMVRTTKGGYDVRCLKLDVTVLGPMLPPPASAHAAWPLGCQVRITADLVREQALREADREEIVQRREGEFFRVRRLEGVALVAPAERVEGKLHRSKGFFSIGGKLVGRDDLAWSLRELGGEYEGKEVVLWGQSHTVKCDPRAQCLIGGELPLFFVAHAQTK